MRYSVAILFAVSEKKTLNIGKSDNAPSKDSWEAVQTALLSGILDFLEAQSTSENRAIVATAFYPTLRVLFFPRASKSHTVGPDLMYILYQLLSETVTSHPANQSLLRGADILGGAQIGSNLSQTKNILIIESLLELFVKLLPAKSSKEGVSSRSSFVKEVFDPDKFTCATTIAEIFESTLTSDWEEIFIRITDILADSNVSFPQPFKIGNFRVHGSKAYNITRLYADYQGFVGNIDKGDQIETFHATFASVQDVQMAAPCGRSISVTLVLSTPPSVGQVALSQESGENTTVLFDVRKEDITRFVQSLQSRDVKNVAQTRKKLSTAEKAVGLGQISETLPISTQDKARDLARLWDAGSQAHLGQDLPTSPLIPRASSVQLQVTSVPQPDLHADEILKPPISLKKSKPEEPSSYYDSIFGSTDEELTDFSDAKIGKVSFTGSAKRTRPKDKRPRVVEDSEEEIPMRRTTRTKKVILSEEEDDGHGARVRLSKRGSLHNPPSLSIAASTPKKPATIGSASANIKGNTQLKTPSPTSTEAPTSISKDSHKNTTRKITALQNQSSMHELPEPNARKRKAVGDPLLEQNDSKRFQPAPQEKPVATSVMKGPRRPAPQKRYGRKGRISSPAASSGLDVDFDELPAPSTNVSLVMVEEKPKNRVAAMKDKTGKSTVSKTKKPVKVKAKQPAELEPFIIQAVDTSKKAKKRIQVKESVQLTCNPSEGNTGLKLIDNGSEPERAKPQRRSAWVAKTTNNSNVLSEKKSAADFVADLKSHVQHTQKAGLQQKKAQDPPWKDLDLKFSDPPPTSYMNSPQAAVLKAPDMQAATTSDPSLSTDILMKLHRVSLNDLVTDAPNSDPALTGSPKPLGTSANFLDLKKQVAYIADVTSLSEKCKRLDPEVSNVLIPSEGKARAEPQSRLSSIQSIDDDSMSDLAMVDTIDDVEEQHDLVDFTIPTKVGSASASFDIESPKRDRTMIDLTGDSPPQKADNHQTGIKAAKTLTTATAPKSPRPQMYPSAQSSPIRRPFPSSRVNTPRVSFAPSATLRPYRIFNLSADTESTSSTVVHQLYRPKRTDKQGYGSATKDSSDSIAEIMNIITEITQVVVHNTSRRFDKVSNDLRAGQRSILCQTAEELKAMYHERWVRRL
ncbi:hypothetical protein H0H81_010819 [Sphagnurus paluster]|uniref:Uncharacterized protein n=1 Tax=Sphagnurus paluster TaxID=117069 RepID=A0A9P7FVX2_9AGAR|nr:hypothetical protein H0H81_010819 [Sphagnurus paluster]